MLFNSYAFLFVFLPMVSVVFFAAGRFSHRLAVLWLAIASLGFYAWWNPLYVGLLVASVLFNYSAGLILLRPIPLARRRCLLAAAIAADLLLLGYFKYANFFLDAAGALFAGHWSLGPVMLPLGISFFTFTQIAFLVDTARGEVAEVDFVRYLLFVTYFPHLIAGPILHHKEMMPQFAQPRISRFRPNWMALGLSVFTVGLLKKVVLADGIAAYATPVFDAAARGVPPSLTEAWGGALAYTLQLYFDFSGYSDMAIGLARMIGVRLPLNFHSPYKAGSIIQFWRRWHMTLSRFLRDYLYFPLGGNRRGRRRRLVNLMVTMLLGGLWHGAGWTYLLWGGVHGFFLVVNHAWVAVAGRFGAPGPVRRLLGGVLTFICVVLAWVIFRAEGLPAAGVMMASLLGWHGMIPAARVVVVAGAKPIDWATGWGWILGLLAVVWLMPNTQEIFARYRMLGADHPRVDKLPIPILRMTWRRSPAAAGLLAVAGVVAVLYLSRGSEFIYFQF